MLSLLIAMTVVTSDPCTTVTRVAYPSTYRATPYVAVQQIQLLPVIDPYHVNLIAGSLRIEKDQAERVAQDAKTKADLDTRLARMEAVLTKLGNEQFGTAGGKPVGAVPSPPSPGPAIEEPQPWSFAGSASAPPTADQNLETKAWTLLSNKCAKCHTSGSEQAEPILFNADGKPAQLDVATLLRIDNAVNSGTKARPIKAKMPPKQPLSLEEYEVVRDWRDSYRAAISAALRPKK